MKFLGTEKNRTTAYNPASNGQVERFHRQLKQAIRCQATERWVEVLPSVLLGIRSCFKEDLGASSAELVYGTTLRLPEIARRLSFLSQQWDHHSMSNCSIYHTLPLEHRQKSSSEDITHRTDKQD
ncbi:hypothetical protein JTE90_025403 [Oedothorax gibbosus]|uniref:Integrase catalytic domain-containing protein n=1 Tax=Oedothorax gibbosus TaxID=931172 RepID=A0AAV6UI43_9ARAC|nr:hypothetical protein JTE90_025403 [Oedothorax gibbosus]